MGLGTGRVESIGEREAGGRGWGEGREEKCCRWLEPEPMLHLAWVAEGRYPQSRVGTGPAAEI